MRLLICRVAEMGGGGEGRYGDSFTLTQTLTSLLAVLLYVLLLVDSSLSSIEWSHSRFPAKSALRESS